MAIENTVSIDFDPRSSIVDYVFDCRLPDVKKGPLKINLVIQSAEGDQFLGSIESVKQIFSAYNCDYFLIHQLKHVFWVLKKPSH